MIQRSSFLIIKRLLSMKRGGTGGKEKEKRGRWGRMDGRSFWSSILIIWLMLRLKLSMEVF